MMVVANVSFYMTIVDGVREYRKDLSLGNLAKKLKISRPTLNKYIDSLKKQGVLNQIGRSWRVDESKLKNFITNLSPVINDSSDNGKEYTENTQRGHAFQVTLTPPRMPSLEHRKKIWEREHIVSVPTKSGTWEGEKIVLGSWNVILTPHSINSYFSKERSLFGQDAQAILLDAIYDWENNVAKKLERLWNCNLKTKTRGGEPAYQIKVPAKHYALVNNSHAKLLKDEKRKLYVRSEDGKLWLIADFSHSVNEMEVVGEPNGKNQEDTGNFFSQRYYPDAERLRMTMQDVVNMFGKVAETQMQTAEMVKEFGDNSKNYAENIKLHLETMNNINKGVTNLNKGVNRLTKAIKPEKKSHSKQATLTRFF